MSGRRWLFAALGGAAALLACNAIIGVEDVKLKSTVIPRADTGPGSSGPSRSVGGPGFSGRDARIGDIHSWQRVPGR